MGGKAPSRCMVHAENETVEEYQVQLPPVSHLPAPHCPLVTLNPPMHLIGTF